MKTIKSNISYIIIFLLISSTAIAQNYQLKGRSSIGFNLGVHTNAESSSSVSVSVIKTNVAASGFIGNMFFAHWIEEDLAVKFSVGLLRSSADVKVDLFTTTEQVSSVIPILLGMNYYIPNPNETSSFRPFITASMGMYIGNETKNSILTQDVRTEAAMGGRVGAGMEFILGSHFILGANLGYNIMSDFNKPVAGKDNYNGADFSFQLNYVF